MNASRHCSKRQIYDKPTKLVDESIVTLRLLTYLHWQHVCINLNCLNDSVNMLRYKLRCFPNKSYYRLILFTLQPFERFISNEAESFMNFEWSYKFQKLANPIFMEWCVS